LDIRVDGKVALVTGATQGIGLAIARVLTASGAAGLLLTGRDGGRGEVAAAELRAAGTPARFVAADLAEPGAPTTVVSAALAEFGRIDALVNAAGLTDRASFLDATPGTWETLFAVNARAPFFLMQAAIRAMLERGTRGAIVNIASINAHCGAAELAVYSATKGALVTLTRNAAHAHATDRIRVNAINVGWTLTPGEEAMQGETLGHGPGWIDAADAAAPFGRLLRAEDIARLAVFLLSDAAGPMTGAIIDQEQWVIGAKP
jgi:NAD(P)-dependent dehydrogenase (short-subunit alcohol dehydrogenase family)